MKDKCLICGKENIECIMIEGFGHVCYEHAPIVLLDNIWDELREIKESLSE